MPAAGPADRAVGSLSALQGDEEAHHADLRGAVAPHPLHASQHARRAPRSAVAAPAAIAVWAWRGGSDKAGLYRVGGRARRRERRATCWRSRTQSKSLMSFSRPRLRASTTSSRRSSVRLWRARWHLRDVLRRPDGRGGRSVRVPRAPAGARVRTGARVRQCV